MLLIQFFPIVSLKGWAKSIHFLKCFIGCHLRARHGKRQWKNKNKKQMAIEHKAYRERQVTAYFNVLLYVKKLTVVWSICSYLFSPT